SSNFSSLTYSSNLLNFTLQASDSPSINGNIPSSLPAAANVNVFGPGAKVLSTQSSGFWCAGGGCSADFGTAGTWALASAPPVTPTAAPSGAPALGEWVLIGLAGAMAVMGGILLRKTRPGISA